MSPGSAQSRTLLVAATTAIVATSGAALPAMAVPRSPAPTGQVGPRNRDVWKDGGQAGVSTMLYLGTAEGRSWPAGQP